jgi:DNA repair ATPase RecN
MSISEHLHRFKSAIRGRLSDKGGLLVSSNARKSTVFVKSTTPLDESLLAQIQPAPAKIESALAEIEFALAEIEFAPAKIESLLAKIESLPAKTESLPAQIQSLLAADESLRAVTRPLPSVNHNNGRKLKAPASNGLRSE